MRCLRLKMSVLAALISMPAWSEPADFATPQDALEAMIKGLRATDHSAILEVFGADAEDYLSDGDPVEDRINRLALLALYAEGYRFVPQEDGSVVIALGEDGWLFPVPIARSESGTRSFDNDAGREEVRLREIGFNEIDVIELLEAYVGIQSDFRKVDHDDDGVREFARRIISSSAEKRDGLFWVGEDTPLGERFARSSMAGFSDGEADYEPEPFVGYYFRLLTEQTDAAPGGAMSYLVNDKMVAGHAMIAFPAEFGETGIHSFMVAENGIILETVLDEEALAAAGDMTAYDPTDDWTPVETDAFGN